MAIPLTVNGATFEYPVNFDENWGIDATGWAQAVTNGMLQRAGGNFPLLADVNFGASFGLIAPYYKSHSSTIAAAGIIRLSKTDTIEWRNNANSADNILAVNGSDNLTFNGSTIGTGGNVNAGTANQLAYYPLSTNSVSGLTSITPNMALESNASGLPVASSVSSATLAFLDATSSIQAQLNTKSPSANPTFTGTVTVPNGINPTDAAAFGQIPTNTVPTGSITMYGAASAPSGWLLCDGSSYATASFPALFALIGYTFGGAGASFNVPSMTNNAPIGAGSIAALGATTGTQTHTISSSELPTHNHTASSVVTDPGHFHNFKAYGVAGGTTTEICITTNANTGGPLNTYTSTTTGPQSNTTGISVATTTGNAGLSTAMSLVQPSIGITFIIKT